MMNSELPHGKYWFRITVCLAEHPKTKAEIQSEVDAPTGTLYARINEMKSQDWIDVTAEEIDGRPKKVYHLNEKARTVMQKEIEPLQDSNRESANEQ